jgi:phage replication-related protein YjqB (UPF0714/DUF867 family)
MDTTHLPPDFKEFIQCINSEKVEYLLVGGYAVGFHGAPRFTADMDIWVGSDPDNAAKLGRALQQFGFRTNCCRARGLKFQSFRSATSK